MKPDYPHLAQRLFNVPLAITPDKLEIVMAALADRFGLAGLRRADGDIVLFDTDYDAGEPAHERPYEVIEGVAVIPIQGTLVAKLGTLHPYSGMTGYDGIRANLLLSLTDDAVRAIVLDIDSPGGEVAGCFDLVDAIHSIRGIKPIHAILTENAFSAAYALASACDSITVPRTGGTGSIGVIVAHVDFSKALTAAGITVTLITYGAHKADANDMQPLADDARMRIQADVDAVAVYMAGGFVASIVSAGVGIASLAVRVAMLARAWSGAGVAAGAATAGRGFFARTLGGVLRFVNPATVGAALALHSEELGTGEDDQLRRIRAAEAAAGGAWPGAAGSQAEGRPGAAAGIGTSVAQWAQRLNFAGLEKQYGLPTGLLAGVAQTESRGNAGAVSRAGAAGLFQFMPATAREYGINALDPAQSANAAAKKLAGLMVHYHGNLSAALSAYNWGEGNLDRKGMANAPAETRAYSGKVLAAMGGGPMHSGVAMPPLNAPVPAMAEAAPPFVHVNTRVHVERDGRTSVRTETPNGLHVVYPMMTS
ncbi:transglycosylase SLT domain-containing protein [Paraburkholderia azotifigens]|uniref:transglycosylase SLT domain-containing protein n=1 Tax=Paraburkholderia azotifigens TaxID=2057004 RepID=UPI00317E2127